jgi:hypothetical protein
MCSSGGQRCKLKLHAMWLGVTLVNVSMPYTWRLLVHYNLYRSQHSNGKILYGLHCGITQDCKRVWLYLGYCWPAYENFSFKTDHPVTVYAQLYIAHILSLHGIPKTIVSDCGSQFVSKFWEELKGKCALGPFLSILVIECQHRCLNVNLYPWMDKVQIKSKGMFLSLSTLF